MKQEHHGHRRRLGQGQEQEHRGRKQQQERERGQPQGQEHREQLLEEQLCNGCKGWLHRSEHLWNLG